MKVRLGEICEIAAGGTPSRGREEYWRGGNIPWVKIGDFNGKYLTETEEKITDLGLSNSSAKLFPKGTILYTIFATLGEVCILNKEASTNQAICGLKIKNVNIDVNYLYHYLCSLKEAVIDRGRGVAQNNINLSILRNFEIEICDLKKQEEISATLDKISTLIEKRKQQLEKLDLLVKSKFIDMFGVVENNIHTYDVIKIKEACELINGRAFKPDEWGSKGLPIVRIQNLNNENAPFNYYDGEVQSQYLIRSGDLLFSWSGTPGTSFGAFFWVRGDAVLNQHIFKVKNKCNFAPVFLQYALNGRLDFIISKAHGGVGLKHITKKELDEVQLLLPPLEQQNEFVCFVEQTDKSKIKIEQSLEKLETLKKALMQKYFG